MQLKVRRGKLNDFALDTKRVREEQSQWAPEEIYYHDRKGGGAAKAAQMRARGGGRKRKGSW